MKKSALALFIAAACSCAHAVEPFTPLPTSATLANTNENANPFLLPTGWLQSEVVDVNAMNTLFGGTYPATFRAWDMLAIGGANHQFIYLPHEVQTGAGVTRYNRDAGTAAVLLKGTNTGLPDLNPLDGWNHQTDDFGAFDPAVISPANTLMVAEEWAGGGRIFEMLNPETATSPADAQWRWLRIPSVSHEGLKFDAAGNLYFVDEWNSGSIKFVPLNQGDYSVGQTFVLRDNDGLHQANQNYNQGTNTVDANRTGAATWIPMTNASGVALTTADPYFYNTANTSAEQGSRGGLVAADELGGTPYGRPEDLEVGTLANGHEVLYVATTSELRVYSIELNPNGDADMTDATVRIFVSAGTTTTSAGAVIPGGNQSSFGLGSPDNLGVDSNGDVMVNEDQNPGDIWVARDTNHDGVAETMDLWASLGPFGSEPSGVIKDPRGGWLVNVQHPSSNNDALWSLLPDSDRDGVPNKSDNCSRKANADQFDADGDGFGNACDADLNNDGATNAVDSSLFRVAFGTANPVADFNHDGAVNALDSSLFRALFGTVPGPARTAE
jgi:hypothetical protein